MLHLIFYENKISFFQHKLFSYSLHGDFKRLRTLQKIILNSLAFRLFIVRNCLIKFNKYHANNCLFNLDSNDKLTLVLNLKDFFYADLVNSFCSFKKSGYSFFFYVPKIFNICYENLLSVSVLSAIESFPDKRSLGFRPFRNYEDVFFEIKNIILKRILLFSFSSKISIFSNIKENYWLLKNLPFQRTFLRSWLLKSYLLANLDKSYFSYGGNILLFAFLNFLLSGLVCFRNAIYF